MTRKGSLPASRITPDWAGGPDSCSVKAVVERRQTGSGVNAQEGVRASS